MGRIDDDLDAELTEALTELGAADAVDRAHAPDDWAGRAANVGLKDEFGNYHDGEFTYSDPAVDEDDRAALRGTVAARAEEQLLDILPGFIRDDEFGYFPTHDPRDIQAYARSVASRIAGRIDRGARNGSTGLVYER
ncbi:MAG: hypothetical protein SVU88_00165 [Candidatus Nanohaloarchaea archaeon]|nr:hypothetical protein [Candidatus Nanohaloarchaea archaeon]